jgi:hypothetical protein
MPIPIFRTATTESIFSPFSGQPADGDEVAVGSDETLLFQYYGEASCWGYVSARLATLLVGVDIEELEPEELAKKVDIRGAFVIEVDADWNGVNWYGFAPKVAPSI